MTDIANQEREFQRKLAARAFNEAWEYLDKSERSQSDIAKMLNLAHTSLYHWNRVGTPRNVAVGNWQLSRIYGAIGDSNLALLFARASLAISEKENLGEVLHSAYEGMARALAISGDKESAREYLSKAKKQLAYLALEDSEDEEIYSSQIADTERLIQ